jgi:hypothetical protein
MIRYGNVATFTLLAGIAACTPPKAPEAPTQIPGQAPEAVFDHYRLTGDVGTLRAKWTRADGEYQWSQLEDVANQFPESADVYMRATSRAIVLNTVAATGGSIVGMTFGRNIVASDDDRWPTGTQEALYGIGAGLILATFIAASAWRNPAEDFAEVYNRALRRQLGLPDAPSAPARGPAAWLPQVDASSRMGWRF